MRMSGRIWYEDSEMEAMCDEALSGAGWPREENGKAIDIDRVVSKHLAIEPVLVDLPEGILGQTKFKPGGAATIDISRTLADEAAESRRGSVHRYRTTLAHEVAHVLFHSCLFIDQGPDLFSGGESQPVSLCRGNSVARFAPNMDWREIQANRGMANLLMPRGELVKELRTMGSVPREEIIKHISKTYLVSEEAAKYRLEKLSPTANNGQTPML